MDIDDIAGELIKKGWLLLKNFERLYGFVQQGIQNEEDGTKLQKEINDLTWELYAVANNLQQECEYGGPLEVSLAKAGKNVLDVFVQFLNNRGGMLEELKEALAELVRVRREWQIKKKMIEEPKRVINTVKYFERIEGSYYEHNYTQKQDIDEAAAEIQKLLDRLAQTFPNITESTLAQAVQVEIKHSPTLKARLTNALKVGGVESLKAIFNHPFVSIPVETIKGFLEAEA